MRMESKLFSLALLVAGLLVPAFVLGHGNQPGEAAAAIGGGTVKVVYTGPALQGRDPLSLIEPGQYWRMGADRATKLTTDVPLKIGDQEVPAGEYTLLVHYSEDGQWHLVVADGVNMPGWQPAKVVAKAPLAKTNTESPAENMKITLEGSGSQGKLVLEWGTNRLAADISAA